MTNEEMLKQDLERAVKELEIDGSNTKQRVKYLLEECLEVYFKPKKYLTFNEIIKLEAKKVDNGIRSSIIYTVKLGEHIYKMVITECPFKKMSLWDINNEHIFDTFLDSDDEDFINDLHLELVEE